MKIIKTPLDDCFVLEPKILHDERGFFYEFFNKNFFEKNLGFSPDFVQDNISKSRFGVVRGLHFQTGDFSQAKLVSCLEGEILDVVLDLRPNSPTFAKFFSIKLSSQNKKQIFIPRGFAHGFATLSDSATIFYKCDNFYSKNYESGIFPLDEDLNIDWQIPKNQIILSEKDKNAKNFKNFLKNE